MDRGLLYELMHTSWVQKQLNTTKGGKKKLCAVFLYFLQHFKVSASIYLCACSLLHFQYAGMWVSSFVSSGPPSMCVLHVCVLDAQHDVVVGAGAGVLPQQSSRLQQSSLARHRHVGRPPRLTVVGGQTSAYAVGAVPHHLLWPVGERETQVNTAAFGSTLTF